MSALFQKKKNPNEWFCLIKVKSFNFELIFTKKNLIDHLIRGSLTSCLLSVHLQANSFATVSNRPSLDLEKFEN